MLGKIEYDVEVPEKNMASSEMIKFYKGFMNDDTHKTASVNYGERKKDAYTAANTLRKHIRMNADNVAVNVRGSVIYITKNEFEPQKVVIPKAMEQKAVERAIAKEVEKKKQVIKSAGRKKKLDSEEVWAYYIQNDGVSQADVARHFGVSAATISNLLKGDRRKKSTFTEKRNGITDAELAHIAGK